MYGGIKIAVIITPNRTAPVNALITKFFKILDFRIH